MDLLLELTQLDDKSKNRVKVMADYGCFPLWSVEPSGPGNLDPRLLPISDELAGALISWSKEYDQTLDQSDPQRSGFSTTQGHGRFVETGRALAAALGVELGTDWSVFYFDDLTGKTKPVLSPQEPGAGRN